MEQQSLLTDIEYNPILASTGKRFLNYLIDIILFDFIIYFIELTINIGTANNPYSYNLYSNALLSLLVNYIFFVIFYCLSEIVFKGRTIGKFITGTKAVNEDGSIMETKTILIRSLCRVVPFEPFSAFGGHPWHDKWSHTYVIDIKKTQAANPSF